MLSWKKLSEARSDWIERFLQQEYEAMNLKLVKSSCNQFTPKNPQCRSCRFYSTKVQETKQGHPCPVWFTVFGLSLRDYVEKAALQGIHLGIKFFDIWYSRKALVEDKIPKKYAVQHSPQVRQIAAGVPVSRSAKSITVIQLSQR